MVNVKYLDENGGGWLMVEFDFMVFYFVMKLVDILLDLDGF